MCSGRNSKPWIIIGVYRPPNSTQDWFDRFNDLVLELLVEGRLIIMGDLNADLLKPDVNPGKSLRATLNLALTSISTISATRYTKSTASCLDIIAVDTRLHCTNYRVDSMAASDHCPVLTIITADHPAPLQPILKRSFNKIDYDSLESKLQSIVLPADPNCLPDELLNSWHGQMIDILDEVAPVKCYPMRGHKTSWLTSDIRQLMVHRDWTASLINQTTDPAVRSNLDDELRCIRRQVKSRIRRSVKDAGKEAFQSNDYRRSWQFINAATFLTTSRDKVSVDLPILNDYFASIVKNPVDMPLELTPSCDAETVFQFNQLTVQQVERMLTEVNGHTATGCDELPGFLLQHIARSIAPNIARILGASFSLNSFPTLWKKANVTAIYKNKGSKNEPANYRPISVLPVIARMFEKAAASQLYNFCDINGSIPPQQFGFRRKSSCEMALLSASDAWLAEVDAGKYVGALLVDLSKAFDCVPHQQLLTELADVGCGLDVLHWFASYLSDRQQRVTQGTEITSWRSVSRGVPQGSCLSPLLFNIFVRQLPAHSQAQYCTQFADDVTEAEADKDPLIVVSKLKEAFRRTKDFCDSHGLQINADKTQMIFFKTPCKKLPADIELLLDGITIRPVSSVKLLGVTIDQHLTMGDHIDKVVRKCQGLLGVLRRAAPFLPLELLRLAYMALIRSHMEYSSALFASSAKTHLDKLDCVQRMASRIICRAPGDAHSEPLQERLQLQSLVARRCQHVANLVGRIIGHDSHPAFEHFFSASLADGALTVPATRLKIGEKRFRHHGALTYNKLRPITG
jgi:Reverse transcriptase (RNA-dependent DNA polymerase)